MSRSVPYGLVAGALSALAFSSLLYGVPGGLLFTYFATLPMMAAGLAFGQMAAMWAALAGIVLSGTVTGGSGAGMFGLTQALPLLMTTRLALMHKPAANGLPTDDGDWYPIGNVVASLSAAGAAMLAFAAAATMDGPAGGMQPWLTEHLRATISAMLPQLAETERNRLTALMVPIFPGIVGASWIVMVTVNAVLAQSILLRARMNIRPPVPYSAIRLPDWISWLLMFAAVIALLGGPQLGYVGRNLVIVVAVPFFLVGLAVVHGLVRATPMPRAMLAGFYAILVMSGWALLVVAGVGCYEQWIGFKGRGAARNGGAGGGETNNGR